MLIPEINVPIIIGTLGDLTVEHMKKDQIEIGANSRVSGGWRCLGQKEEASARAIIKCIPDDIKIEHAHLCNT